MAAGKRRMPEFTKPPAAMVELFGRTAHRLPGVEPRRMFGYPAAFVNGNMFACLFQDRMMLRLSEKDRKESGFPPFEPSPGRAMREYVTLPPEVLGSEKR